jgi:hypothetical protein
VFEAHTVTRPTFPAIATYFFNPIFKTFTLRDGYLPFETINIIRRIALSLFIAAAQIAPQFRSRTEVGEDSPEQQQQALNQLAGTLREIDADAGRMLNLETAPFLGDDALEARLKEELTSWLVQNEVRNAPEVQRAIQRVVERKNEEQMAASL